MTVMIDADYLLKIIGGMIKLGTFVNVEAVEMFMDYFEEKGITVAAYRVRKRQCG